MYIQAIKIFSTSTNNYRIIQYNPLFPINSIPIIQQNRKIVCTYVQNQIYMRVFSFLLDLSSGGVIKVVGMLAALLNDLAQFTHNSNFVVN